MSPVEGVVVIFYSHQMIINREQVPMTTQQPSKVYCLPLIAELQV